MNDIQLYKPEHFDKRFEEYSKRCDTYIRAYRLTERDFKKVFGERKYSSYNSFRNAYNMRKRCPSKK